MKNQEKRKLTLDEIKVESFVTAFDKKNGQTQEVVGGTICSTITIATCPNGNTCFACNGGDATNGIYCTPSAGDCCPDEWTSVSN